MSLRVEHAAQRKGARGGDQLGRNNSDPGEMMTASVLTCICSKRCAASSGKPFLTTHLLPSHWARNPYAHLPCVPVMVLFHLTPLRSLSLETLKTISSVLTGIPGKTRSTCHCLIHSACSTTVFLCLTSPSKPMGFLAYVNSVTVSHHIMSAGHSLETLTIAAYMSVLKGFPIVCGPGDSVCFCF